MVMYRKVRSLTGFISETGSVEIKALGLCVLQVCVGALPRGEAFGFAVCFAIRREARLLQDMFSGESVQAIKKVLRVLVGRIRLTSGWQLRVPSPLQGHDRMRPPTKGHPWPITALATSMSLNPFHVDSTRPPEGDLGVVCSIAVEAVSVASAIPGRFREPHALV